MSEKQLRSTEQVVTDALRAEANDLLGMCTDKQQAFFAKIFPAGIDKLTDEKLKHAIGLCRRTLQKKDADV